MRHLLFATVIALSAGAANAKSPRATVDDWIVATSICQGTSGPASEQACVRRDRLSRQLERQGWCYGTPDQPSYQREWHPCGGKPKAASTRRSYTACLERNMRGVKDIPTGLDRADKRCARQRRGLSAADADEIRLNIMECGFKPGDASPEACGQ